MCLQVTNSPRDLIDIFNMYPYFSIRVLIVITITVAFFLYVLSLRNKAYVRMIKDKDSTTGLINWNKFKEMVKEEIDKNPNNKYAIIQFDIDKFKVVNDLYGIEGGNTLLKMIASELSNMLDKNEIATRFYADIFCLLITYTTDDEITGFIHNVSERIKNCYISVNLVLIFGIYKVTDNISIQLMIDRASFARKSVKDKGVNYYSFFDKNMLDRVLREKNIEDNMQTALDTGQFEAYLQPQYSVVTEKIVSAEALVRWNDPIKKTIPPSEFIDVFEKNNFIIKLDVYVWKQVCKYILRWIKEGRRPYPISINVSTVHFRNRTIIQEISEIVNEYNIPLKYLELEITESTLLNDLDYAIETIDKLHDLGFRIAMDDFGSGYSSLNILNKLSIDVLKIDREFLNDASNSEKGKIVINDIITMAKHLNMDVVCEGVENLEQVEYLKETDCDKIQGFYYAKPMSIIEFEKKYY